MGAASVWERVTVESDTSHSVRRGQMTTPVCESSRAVVTQVQIKYHVKAQAGTPHNLNLAETLLLSACGWWPLLGARGSIRGSRNPGRCVMSSLTSVVSRFRSDVVIRPWATYAHSADCKQNNQSHPSTVTPTSHTRRHHGFHTQGTLEHAWSWLMQARSSYADIL